MHRHPSRFLSGRQLDDLHALIVGRRGALHREIQRSLGNNDDALLPVEMLADLAPSVLTRDIRELEALADAETRMQAGTFGECIDCAGAIEYSRLLAHPTAERCLRCQEKYEASHPTETLS